MRDARTNRRIRAREVRLIGSDGSQLGVVTVEAALARSGEEGLDLVEISPMARPPVCKIMDYGKFKYETKKKATEARKKQVVVQLKEVKLRPKTDEHDYDFKVKNVRRFLEEGNKARVTIMFRGREITHKEIGQRILQDVANDVKEVGVIEQAPRQEGRQMFMILAPNAKYLAQLREKARAADVESKRAERAERKAEARKPVEAPAEGEETAAPAEATETAASAETAAPAEATETAAAAPAEATETAAAAPAEATETAAPAETAATAETEAEPAAPAVDDAEAAASKEA